MQAKNTVKVRVHQAINMSIKASAVMLALTALGGCSEPASNLTVFVKFPGELGSDTVLSKMVDHQKVKIADGVTAMASGVNLSPEITHSKVSVYCGTNMLTRAPDRKTQAVSQYINDSGIWRVASIPARYPSSIDLGNWTSESVDEDELPPGERPSDFLSPATLKGEPQLIVVQYLNDSPVFTHTGVGCFKRTKQAMLVAQVFNRQIYITPEGREVSIPLVNAAINYSNDMVSFLNERSIRANSEIKDFTVDPTSVAWAYNAFEKRFKISKSTFYAKENHKTFHNVRATVATWQSTLQVTPPSEASSPVVAVPTKMLPTTDAEKQLLALKRQITELEKSLGTVPVNKTASSPAVPAVQVPVPKAGQAPAVLSDEEIKKAISAN